MLPHHHLLPHQRLLHLEAQRLVESVRGALVLGAQALHHLLRVGARRHGGVVGAANVDELVADEVGDDVGVQRVGLAAPGDERVVRGEEGPLVRPAVELGAAELEVNGRRAVAEVRTGGLRRGGADDGEEDEVGLHLGVIFERSAGALWIND